MSREIKEWRHKSRASRDELASSIKEQVKEIEKEIIKEIGKTNPRLEELDQNWIKHFTREYLDLKARQEETE